MIAKLITTKDTVRIEPLEGQGVIELLMKVRIVHAKRDMPKGMVEVYNPKLSLKFNVEDL